VFDGTVRAAPPVGGAGDGAMCATAIRHRIQAGERAAAITADLGLTAERVGRIALDAAVRTRRRSGRRTQRLQQTRRHVSRLLSLGRDRPNGAGLETTTTPTMTRTRPFRTPTAVLALLALAAVIFSPAAAANTFKYSDADAFLQLDEAALALHKDINNAMTILGKSREFDQASCLSDLENVLLSVDARLSSVSALVRLSAQMRDSMDETTVKFTLALNASTAMKELAEDRRYALAQGAICSTSALVNTYAQKAAAITDKAALLFGSIDNRVGSFARASPTLTCAHANNRRT
jgi:hypothetical protein